MARLEGKDLDRQVRFFSEQLLYKQLFDKIPDLILILNQYRQAVYANLSFFKFFDFLDNKTTLGKRPGEIFSCVYSFKELGGCGNAKECQYCGAFVSILSALNENENTNECQILDKENNSLTLRVSSAPTFINDEKYVIFSLYDISDEKRKEILERVFFHDILNTASSITSISILLDMDLPDEYNEYKTMLKDSSKRLIDEIQNHKQLVQAEKDQLEVKKVKMNTLTFANEMIRTNSAYDFAKNSEIRLSNKFEEFEFESDPALLGRIVSNLLKNALEAVYPSGTVTLSAFQSENSFSFSVHNNLVMSEEVQSKIFRKSFSTKGTGRGIGTYSIKLFTEKYLKGKAWFESTKEEGTSFFIQFNK
jgi:signal transduction histidine kinase